MTLFADASRRLDVMAGSQEVEIAGEGLRLLSSRAIFWESESTVFVADVHLGKAATMRAASIPFPDADIEADLVRVSAILDATAATRLVVLGDLLHHRSGREPLTFDAVERWRRTIAASILLVEGNHDRSSGGVPASWDIEVAEEGAVLGPFELAHYPRADEPGACYRLAGHLHPAARLTGRGDQHLRLPCFWFQQHAGVLPAFGSLCGRATVSPVEGDGVYGIADDTVVPLASPSESIRCGSTR